MVQLHQLHLLSGTEEAGMNKNVSFYQFDKKEKLYEELINTVVSKLESAVEKDGIAIIAVSGGSTPKQLFEKLSHMNLPWEKIYITLVDERWVPNTHEDSNEKLVKDFLIQNKAVDANFIPLKLDFKTPFEAVKECGKQFETFKEKIDIVILGMGGDAHTASFFPKDENLHNAFTTKEICAATIPTDAPHQRMTFSLSKLLEAKDIFLHIEGEKKLDVYQKASHEGVIEAMPIRAFLFNEKPIKVYYAD